MNTGKSPTDPTKLKGLVGKSLVFSVFKENSMRKRESQLLQKNRVILYPWNKEMDGNAFLNDSGAQEQVQFTSGILFPNAGRCRIILYHVNKGNTKNKTEIGNEIQKL